MVSGNDALGNVMNKSEQKIALVTGASSGIGKATADALVQSGFTVFGSRRRTIDSSVRMRNVPVNH